MFDAFSKYRDQRFFPGQIAILTVVLCFLNISGSRVAYADGTANSPAQGENGGGGRGVESCLFPLQYNASCSEWGIT